MLFSYHQLTIVYLKVYLIFTLVRKNREIPVVHAFVRILLFPGSSFRTKVAQVIWSIVLGLYWLFSWFLDQRFQIQWNKDHLVNLCKQDKHDKTKISFVFSWYILYLIRPEEKVKQNALVVLHNKSTLNFWFLKSSFLISYLQRCYSSSAP